MPAKSTKDPDDYAELLGPTSALAAAFVRLKDEYFNVCASLDYSPYDRPLSLFMLSMGRLASTVADEVSMDVDVERDVLVEDFIGKFAEGVRLRPNYSGGETIQ